MLFVRVCFWVISGIGRWVIVVKVIVESIRVFVPAEVYLDIGVVCGVIF